MAAECELTIWETGTGHVLLPRTRLRMPVLLGRHGEDARGRAADGTGREVFFGSGLSTLSREHMRIEPGSGGGAVVTDKSSNGIEKLRPGNPPEAMASGSPDPMPAGAMREFGTVGLTIQVGLPSERIESVAVSTGLYAVYASRSGVNKSINLDGKVIAFVDDGGGVDMQPQPEADSEAAFARVTEEIPNCLGVLGFNKSGALIALATRDGAMTCNRAALAPRVPRELVHLDTIEFGELAVHIMSRDGGKALICINPDCRQLNPYAPSVNCRFCGTRLGDAHTMILPQGGRA